MELHISNSHLVVLQRLVRRGSQIQIEPDHPPVVAAHQHVVPRWVDVQRRQPLAVGEQPLH